MEDNVTTQAAPIIDEGQAELVWRLNETLREHIPASYLGVPHALTVSQERQFAVLGARNVLHRMNLNYPDDVLTEQVFARVATDLIHALDGPNNDGTSFTKGWIQQDLKHYQNMGLIVPRYRVKEELFHPGLHRQFHYSQDGKLISLTFGGWNSIEKNPSLPEEPPHIPPFISPIIYYRERGTVLEWGTPGTADYKRSTPLFCFSQLAQFLEVRRIATTSIDLLTTNPEQYRDFRNFLLPHLKKRLEKLGSPRFCQNPPCLRPLENDIRNLYCDERCQAAAIQRRKRRPKNPRPFESVVEEPVLPVASTPL